MHLKKNVNADPNPNPNVNLILARRSLADVLSDKQIRRRFEIGLQLQLLPTWKPVLALTLQRSNRRQSISASQVRRASSQ